MKFYSLCSSSKGNCTYIGTENHGVLVDAGIGLKKILQLLKTAGVDISHVASVCITHEHSDHIKGLAALTSNFSIPVYGTKGTLIKLLNKNSVGKQTLLYEISRKSKQVSDFKITPFHTLHDSADSVGYTVEDGNCKIGICTDLGKMTEEVFQHLTDCSFVMIEANYDPDLLMMGKYPYSLKKRIASDYGHLSNQDAAYQISRLVRRGVQHFVLGHLSQENNTPLLAKQTVVSYLTAYGIKENLDYTLDVALPQNDGKIFEVK